MWVKIVGLTLYYALNFACIALPLHIDIAPKKGSRAPLTNPASSQTSPSFSNLYTENLDDGVASSKKITF